VEGSLPFPAPDPVIGATTSFIEPSVVGGEELYLFDYSAPFPEVLLSEGFARQHCFSVKRARDQPGMVGLAFEPNRATTLDFDVEGVLWLPERSLEWPWIQFQYTRLPRQDELTDRRGQACWKDGCYHRRGPWYQYFPAVSVDERFGGRLHLARVDGLGWFVNRVRMQTPVVMRRRFLAIKPQYEHDLLLGRPIGPSQIGARNLLSVWYVLEETREVLEVKLIGDAAPGR
jgi:hypothetical protein